MKFFKKIILILIFSINICNVFGGFLPETMLLVGNGTYLKAKNLAVGDFLPIYDISTHSFDEKKQKIVKINTRNSKTVVVINFKNENNIDEIIVGENQKLYNRKITKFIPAKEFKRGDILFSPEKGNLIVNNVSLKELNEPIKLYDLALEDSGIFLIITKNKTHILAHDFVFAPKILTWELASKLIENIYSGACSITASVLYSKYKDKHEKMHKS